MRGSTCSNRYVWRYTGITAQGENTLGEGAWVTSRVLVAVDGAALTAGALYAYGPGRAAAPLVAVGEFQQLPLWLPLNAQRQLRSEEHTSELQSRGHLVCRLLL